MTIEIKPRSLFSKHSFIREQILIEQFARQVDMATMFVQPYAVASPFPFQKLPEGYRRTRIQGHLKKARDILQEIGV